MNNMAKTLISALCLAALLSSCGESFQATYVGEGTVQEACGGRAENPYNMEVKATISGDDVEFLITKLVSKSNSREDFNLTQHVYGTPVYAKFYNGKENFSADLQTYENSQDQVAIHGSLNSARDQINSFAFDRVRVYPTGQQCLFSLRSGSLQRKE